MKNSASMCKKLFAFSVCAFLSYVSHADDITIINKNADKCAKYDMNDDVFYEAIKSPDMWTPNHFDELFSNRTCFDGGHAEDYTRALSVYLEIKPDVVLKALHESGDNDYFIESIATSLPEDLVDNYKGRLERIIKRKNILVKVLPACYKRELDIMISAIDRYQEMLIKIIDEDKNNRTNVINNKK